MQNQYPLLIFAQSARFIAQSAIRAGYTVRVADCFGDQDLLDISDQFIPLPSLDECTPSLFLETIEKLSSGNPCELVIGTGLEHFFSLLSELPKHIHYIGNTTSTIQQVREAGRFFKLLDSLNLSYPLTQFAASAETRLFLRKNMRSCGGQAVMSAHDNTLRTEDYFQEHIDGQSASVTFLADGTNAKIVAINQQYHDVEFTLTGISQPLLVSHQIEHYLEMAINKITQATRLRGFNSLDVMIDRHDKIFILEVNPRISASVELLPLDDIFTIHKRACDGEPIPTMPFKKQNSRLLQYLFADKPLRVNNKPNWPSECRDLPASQSHINTGDPICTVIIEIDNEANLNEKLASVEQLIRKNCLCDA